MIDYYDSVLLTIFGSLVSGASIGVLTSVPVNYGVASSSVLSMAVMYYAMFQRSPVTDLR